MGVVADKLKELREKEAKIGRWVAPKLWPSSLNAGR